MPDIVPGPITVTEVLKPADLWEHAAELARRAALETIRHCANQLADTSLDLNAAYTRDALQSALNGAADTIERPNCWGSQSFRYSLIVDAITRDNVESKRVYSDWVAQHEGEEAGRA